MLVVAIWIALSGTILIDRSLHDRRARRSTQLRARLRVAPAAAGDAARQMTPGRFQDLVLAGVPPEAETTLADQICARSGDRQLRMIADGTLPAGIAARIAALQVLVSARRPDAYDALDRCLRSGERNLAAAAVRMLIRLDDRRAAEILIAALCDGAHPGSRLAAAIDRMSVARADLLAPLLDHPEAPPRFWGVRLAGRLRAAEWAARVRALTADADPLVRRAAVETLGVIGNQKDRVLLLTRFLDPVPMVRVHAARASAAFGSAPVADALAELLGDREWIVRAAAREALRRIGDPAAPALIRALSNDDAFAANSAAEVLFLTGAMATVARRLVRVPGDREAIEIVRRFSRAAGPHLNRALREQLDPDEAAQFDKLAGEATDAGARPG